MVSNIFEGKTNKQKTNQMEMKKLMLKKKENLRKNKTKGYRRREIIASIYGSESVSSSTHKNPLSPDLNSILVNFIQKIILSKSKE